jgi:hypothetical protein
MSSFSLGASVGRNATNDPTDVRALRRHLRGLGFDWLAEGDVVDADLVAVIDLVQSIRNGRHQVRGDGVVDVPGATHTFLRAHDVTRWQRMTPGGGADDGFVNIELLDPNDDHEFGTSWMAQTIEDAGRAYHDGFRAQHPRAAAITVNDVSRPRGGPTPDHSGHETGLAADLRLPRRDGTAPGNTRHTSDTYDRDVMRAQLRATRHQPMVHRILFNDPTLIGEHLCTRAAGHDDHVHVEIAPLPALVGYGDDYPDRLDAAIGRFGGTVVAPTGYPMTREGFGRYLDDTGVAHFSANEMLRPHKADVARRLGYDRFLPPHSWWPRGAALALIADELRRLVGEPVMMRNWWRPVAYNREVGGAADSDHVTGHGVDLDYRSADSRRRAEARLRELYQGEEALELSLGLGNVTTHVGLLSPGRKRDWFYSSYVP